MEHTQQKHSEIVKAYAQEVGFDLCGITSPDIIPEAKNRYIEWIKGGYHAEMGYLENIERRTNPRAVMQDAESVIMFATNYYSAEVEEQPSNKIARYARGRDYHKVIGKMLKHMCLKLAQEFPEHTFKFFVDYGPFLERPYAEKAGLGFIGKNGNLITKEFGSWVLLSEIITTLPIAFDQPAIRSCGTCTKCLDGCPTDAFITPGMLDSSKCIAYQTIENKRGDIPAPIRKQLSGWSFGCDICQEVCPFNNALRQKETGIADLKPRYASFDEMKATFIHETEFFEKFKGTPIMRAKRKGVLRNMGITSTFHATQEQEESEEVLSDQLALFFKAFMISFPEYVR